MDKSTQTLPRTRPTSPHLSIYKPQISSVLSIGHRITGVGLFISLSAIAWWFILWVFSNFDPCYFHILSYPLTKVMLFITSYGFFYHLCTGIRHLGWDLGKGFSICAINYSGWLAIISSIGLTILFWMWI